MVSAFDSESIGPGLSPGQGQVYKWVPANLILLVASCYRNQDKLWPDGPQLAGMQT